MSEGFQTRRTRSGLAWMVVTIAFGAGCTQLPVPRANTTPIHLPKPATAPPGADPTTGNAPETPPPTTAEAAVPPTEPSSVTNATPLIDEALARAEALKRLEVPATEEPKTGHVETSATKEAPPEAEPPAAPLPQPVTTVAMTSPVQSDKGKDSAKPTDTGKPIDPDKPAEPPPTPRERWRRGLELLRTLVEERQGASDPTATPWPLRARLLDALAQTEESDSADRQAWKTVLTALAIAGGRPPEEPHSRALEIRAAVEALEDQAPLEMTELRLCRKVVGFGNFEPMDPSSCKAGQTLIVYCEMSGIRATGSGEMFRSRLSSHVELISPHVDEPVWKQDLGTAEDVCRRRRRDYFVNYRLTLPDPLAPGTYTLRLTQHDELAGRSTSSTIPLTIQP